MKSISPILTSESMTKNQSLRIAALQEIWKARGFEGIKLLLSKSNAAFTVGWHMVDGVIDFGITGFLEQCLKVQDQDLAGKLAEAIRGFPHLIPVFASGSYKNWRKPFRAV